MSNALSAFFSRAFVTLYVVYGVFRHYVARLTWRSVVTGLLVFAMVTGILLNTLLKPAPSGNDALERGYDLRNAGRFVAAHGEFEKAYEIFRTEDYGRGMFVALRALGETALIRSNPREALLYFDEALRLAQAYNDNNAQISLFIKLADIKLRLNRFDAARAHLYDALKIAEDDGQFEKTAAIFTQVANIERHIGNDRRARWLYRRAGDIYADHPNLMGEAALQQDIGLLESGLENYDAAMVNFNAAQQLFKSAADIDGEATVFVNMARLEKKLGSAQQAAAYYNEATTLFASIGKTDEVEALRIEANGLSI